MRPPSPATARPPAQHRPKRAHLERTADLVISDLRDGLVWLMTPGEWAIRVAAYGAGYARMRRYRERGPAGFRQLYG